MFVLFLAVALILFGFGFLNPLWWMAVAVLVFRSHPLRPRSRRRTRRVRMLALRAEINHFRT